VPQTRHVQSHESDERGVTGISTAHSPKPRDSQFARMRPANSSLSAAASGFGRNSITRGSALRAANAGKSASRHGRNSNRGVVSVGIVGIGPFYRFLIFVLLFLRRFRLFRVFRGKNFVSLVRCGRCRCEIVYSDEWLIVLDKPSGLLAVPGLGPENQGQPGQPRAARISGSTGGSPLGPRHGRASSFSPPIRRRSAI